MSVELNYRIRHEFGSVEQLKSTVGATALGMFSSGWIWLVCDQQGSLAVFPTFGTGTLLIRSRQKVYEDRGSGSVVGEIVGELPSALGGSAKSSSGPSSSSSKPHSSAPPPAPSSPASGVSHHIPPLHPSTPSRTFSTSSPALDELVAVSLLDEEAGLADRGSRLVNQLKVGRKLYPLLCLSVHERVWVDAGYGVWGKEEYAKRFWSVVDWEKVSLAYKKFFSTGRY
ncbi:hypothetical protein NLI96_g6125 [Meripilus lineatus]|uniref:Manganese/iron superoxide dismutase C-terminal domain-containing protein n=1 Tax=Meripilus lineatus TaxID=2056292 RepID=A0AAD5V412_9APHY|nr:hypothetical protein NLI96_g6125 [Physisporinus lineatus]